MTANSKKDLSSAQAEALLKTLKARFEKNRLRHKDMEWAKVEARLNSNMEKLWSLNEMENSGGEPDVLDYDKNSGEYIFYDCAAESPKERRSLCYDREALDARKEFKPKNAAVDMVVEMGVELLNEEEYRYLQQFGDFDTKTSSWIKTPDKIRKLGGAIFADFRFDHVFVYHNGASSYYAGRGFRTKLAI